jgi:hypothetical protein
VPRFSLASASDVRFESGTDFWGQVPISALPPKADMAQRGYCHVRFVPSKLMSGAAGVTLAARHQAVVGGRLVFDRQTDGRVKTGRAAIGTISTRTERLLSAYLAKLQIDLHPDAILFRTRYGNRDTLAHDFAAVRTLAFPGDKRRLMDMRRSGVVEAVAGDAGPDPILRPYGA